MLNGMKTAASILELWFYICSEPEKQKGEEFISFAMRSVV
jgi:hypothetical protein